MFGFRADGKKIKTIDPTMKLIPHVMTQRNDAMVMTPYEIDCKGMDEYIFKRRKEGVYYTYMDIIIAACARTLATRPKLNRFIMNGRVFKRNVIEVSFTVKKVLQDGGEETEVKLDFTGLETLSDVHAMMEKEISANTKKTSNNDTDDLAKILTRVPNGIIKFMVGTLKFMDKHGLLPMSIIRLSPFHTSLFITNMKSIKMNYVYHHLYNFGTTSIFLSMGKEHYEPVVLDPDENIIGVKKLITIGAVIDERICDGLYYGNSFRDFKKFIENPAIMDTAIEKRIEDIK
jgi:hypothetical protein